MFKTISLFWVLEKTNHLLFTVLQLPETNRASKKKKMTGSDDSWILSGQFGPLFRGYLVGDFYPSEKYKSNWIISPSRDEH